MKVAYFPGCKIPHHLPQYGKGVEAVCAAFDLELIPLEFNCCGWPLRDESYLASMFSAARNLALAGRSGLPILTPCKCCFGQLKHAVYQMKRTPSLYKEINRLLALEGLEPAEPEVWHFLSVMDEVIGAERIAEKVRLPLDGLRVACHYGCHALRPSKVTDFDDPLNPHIFERVVEALGAEALHWDLRLECCGQPLRGKDDAISDALMKAKLLSAKASGADIIATACTYCQMQFNAAAGRCNEDNASSRGPQVVPVTRLLTSALNLQTDDSLTAEPANWRKS